MSCEAECFYHIGGGSAMGLRDFRDHIASGKCNSAFNEYNKDEVSIKGTGNATKI